LGTWQTWPDLPRPTRNDDSMTSRAGQISALMVLFLSVIFAPGTADANVLEVSIEGTITPASNEILGAAIEQAQSQDYEAIILVLNTPGGGLQETISMLGRMDKTPIPVIGYVYPEGANAWSAGTMILMGSDIAAMAPHAIIGSAQPVQVSATGGTTPINDTKTVNAVVALITEKARAHDRNVTAAREFVVNNLNLNADDAKRYGVVEFVSPSIDDLLSQVNGTRVKNVTLNTSGSPVDTFEPPLSLAFLKLISDPTIAGLLMLIGIYALIFGLSSPGLGAEVFGVIALALGLIGLGFDVNLGALFLILLGIGLLLAELHSHSFGVLAVAGLACIIAGSTLFVPTGYPERYLPISYQRSMIVAFVLPSLIMGAFFAFAVYKVAKARLARPFSDQFVGERATALDRLGPKAKGYVQFQGEYWLAVSDEAIEPGEAVVVVEKTGSVLKVRRA